MQPVMDGSDRRRVWIKALVVLGIVALAVIGIFAANNTRDHNECPGGICGSGNINNQINPAESAK